MSHHWALKQSSLAVVVLTLVLAGTESLSYGVGNLPATPCPCAADGICRPKRDSWGHYETRWRSWPGESVSQQPTPADDAGGEGAPLALPPYETPLPEEEDLRGPAKDKAAKSDKDESVEAPLGDNPGAEPGQLLPGPEALPAFDPQGNQLEPPATDDAPPALPASLRQAAWSLNMPSLTNLQQPPAKRPTASQPIRQASWQQPTSIQLVNPASANVLEPEAGALQQAIYYEASDLSNDSQQQ